MKKCLYCKNDFEPNRPKQKYCSDKCRVYFSRANPKPKEVKEAVTNLQVQVLYNSLLETLGKLNGAALMPLPGGGNVMLHGKPEKEPTTFQDFLNGMADLHFPDEKEEYAEKIKSATHLSDKQTKLLLTNLWSG